MTSLRVLVCEDSASYAAALQRMLEYGGDIRVAAVCGTAEEAISVLPRIAPDLVTMDVGCPAWAGWRRSGKS